MSGDRTRLRGLHPGQGQRPGSSTHGSILTPKHSLKNPPSSNPEKDWRAQKWKGDAVCLASSEPWVWCTPGEAMTCRTPLQRPAPAGCPPKTTFYHSVEFCSGSRGQIPFCMDQTLLEGRDHTVRTCRSHVTSLGLSFPSCATLQNSAYP